MKKTLIVSVPIITTAVLFVTMTRVEVESVRSLNVAVYVRVVFLAAVQISVQCVTLQPLCAKCLHVVVFVPLMRNAKVQVHALNVLSWVVNHLPVFF